MARRIAMEIEHRMDAREKEIKIKVETSTKGIHHYEASIRTTGEVLDVDELFTEAMRLVDKMDSAMASKNTGLLD
jgi:hypothetical protein